VGHQLGRLGISGSSGRPGPLVGDGRELGRWGPGVPMSHKPPSEV
jgi:hypothetical protein